MVVLLNILKEKKHYKTIEIRRKANKMAIYRKIEGKSVYLSPATIEDADFTYRIRQDKERTKYMHRVEGGVEAQKNWINNQREREGDYFFVVFTSEGMPIGTASAYNINNNEAEIGRVLLNGNKIQNIEALVLIYDFAFYHIKVDMIKAEIAVDNIASLGVALRMGGVETYRDYNEEVSSEMVWVEVYKEEYFKRHDGLIKLIDRFGNR